MMSTNDVRKQIWKKYMNLPITENIALVTYVWIDGTGVDLRSKTRTLDFVPKRVEDVPKWNFGGCGTYQAETSNSDTHLHPVALYEDPFMAGNHKLVLCQTHKFNMKPSEVNRRHSFMETYEQCKVLKPRLAIRQEYTMLDADKYPFGWPKYGIPWQKGSSDVNGRDLVEAHYRACLYAGINLFTTNTELVPPVWSFDVGPSEAASAADDLWMARFVLTRVSEDFGIVVTFNPNPFAEGWRSLSCQANFSTEAMRRDEDGITEINRAVIRLRDRHQHHLEVYNENNECFNSQHDPENIQDLMAGCAIERIVIQSQVGKDKKGYLEDRRPPANCDPYSLAETLLRTICFA